VFYSSEELPLANRKFVHILGVLVLLQVALPAAFFPTASAASCIQGILQPPPNRPWIIYEDTTIGAGCYVTHPNDVYLIGAKRLAVAGGSLNVTGNITISQAASLEVTANGVVRMQSATPGMLMQVFTGAVVVVDHSTLELDGLSAPGVPNQANLELRNSTVTARGYFNASMTSVTVRQSVLNVTAPPVGTGQTGGDVFMRVGGRIAADILDATFIARGAAGGFGTQGARGGDGGNAVAIFDGKFISRSTITVAGGTGGTGGRGANGGSGGDGGIAGYAKLSFSSETISATSISVKGGDGGNGGRGSDAKTTSAGSGGAGKPGGFAVVDANGASFALRSSSLSAMGGNGGSGGSGGNFTGSSINMHGGNAGAGAAGGAAIVTLSGRNQAAVSYSTVSARGGAGGLGGNYGPGTPLSSSTNGKPGEGGEGGRAVARTNSSTLSMVTDNSTVVANGGSGGNGGGGGIEGGSGGNGGDGLAGAFGRFSLLVTQSCYNATGGDGGAGAAASGVTGFGGNAGNATVRINGTGLVTIDRACAGADVGKPGSAEPLRVGLRGLDDLHVNGSQLAVLNSNFGNPLDDFAGCIRSSLYNVLFTRQFSGSEVIPLGCGVLDRLWDLDVYVFNGQEPIPSVNVAVSRCKSFGEPFFVSTLSEVSGHGRFVLLGASYTSDVLKPSFVGCYDVETSLAGNVKGPYQISMDKAIDITVVYPANVFAPVVTILSPRPLAYVINADHPNIELVLKVDDYDDVLSGIPTLFKVSSCLPTREARCLDLIDISNSRAVNNNTHEVTYNWTFDVSSFAEFPSDVYYVCGMVNDGVLKSPWTCVNITINQDVPTAPPVDVSAGAHARDTATEPVNFDGRVNNLDRLLRAIPPITILVYRWDFDGDGIWDYQSGTNGSTIHIYPQVPKTTRYMANFSVIDSLGRETWQEREITIDPIEYAPVNVLWQYAYVIGYSVFGIVGLTAVAFTLQKRHEKIAAEEARQREEEILANIHECPRCGDLLPEKFAICTHCATEDAIANARKTVAELKQVGIIVLEEEDLIDKGYVAFEARDFPTATQFLDKVKKRVDLNKKRHNETTRLIRRERLYIKMLEEQGKSLSALEPEVYHAELALGRSDFDGAAQMVETIRKKIQATVYEDRKRDILERITKLERGIKANTATDAAGSQKALDGTRLLERAKLALGKKLYLDSVTYYTEAFTAFEGAPPEPLLKEPTDEELDLFETRLKMQEEGVYMGPAQKPSEEKVWRPGEREFKIETGEKVWRPGDSGTTMGEGQAHGHSLEGPTSQARPGAPKPTAPAPAPPPPPPAPPAAATPGPPAPRPQAPAPSPPAAKPLTPPSTAPAAPAASPAATQAAQKCPKCSKPVKPQWKKCPYCMTVLHD
jgi:hypothetical protein